MGKCWSHTEEAKKRISESKMGIKNPFYGKPHTEEWKRKMSEVMKGRKLTNEWKKKIGQSNRGNRKFLGKKHSLETRKKMSEKAKEMIANGLRHVPKGSEHCNWKGGISETYRKKINARKWQDRAREIRKRDNYTCQQCFEPSVYDVHHLIPWDLSHNDNENNLITLCRSCHMKLERTIG